MPLTAAQAVAGRDALAKEAYARLFLRLVGQINASTAAGELPPHVLKVLASRRPRRPRRSRRSRR